MPNLEWEVEHQLITPEGTLTFNVPDSSGRIYIVQPDDYSIVPSMRVTADNLSQTDGSYLHPRWKTGLTATMRVEFGVVGVGGDLPDYTPACGQDLRIMWEDLTAALDSIREQVAVNSARLIWMPTGTGARMIDDIQTVGWPTPSFSPPGAYATFSVESPFPYAIDFTQQTTTINATTTTITNNGTADLLPVCKVFGAPTSSFTLTNASVVDEFGNPLELFYDSSRPGAIAVPGGGQYAEIDFFKGTIFLNGNSTDLIAGLDPTVSEFFALAKGANVITTDCDAQFLWNPAWS